MGMVGRKGRYFSINCGRIVIIISYFRSSSYNNWAFCQQQYFLSYVLGQTYLSNLKADKGTIVHKVFECLAQVNLAMVNEQDFFDDEHLGKIKFDKDKVLETSTLEDEKVDFINKTRKNKAKYKNQSTCKLNYGAVRYGVELVEELIDKSYEYYTTRLTHHDWKPIDFKDCTNWVWMGLDYGVGSGEGLFDPRGRKIVAVEPHFDFELDEDWASYITIDKEGNPIQNQLSLKGTIDLVTEVNEDTIEVIDWKTGQRLDWATGQPKTYEMLKTDPQLLLYNRAIRHMYPQYKNVICTIFYIRDGGPYSIALDESHAELMEEKIQERFNEIMMTEEPKMIHKYQKDWRCKQICGFYKKKWPGTNHNVCKYVHQHTKRYGIDKTIEECTEDGHSVDTYSAPGEV